jgi:hypothetical protein
MAGVGVIGFALDPWCAAVHHLGPLGAGQIAKSANNLVHWEQICAIGEALDLARRHGLWVPAVTVDGLAALLVADPHHGPVTALNGYTKLP